MKEGYHLDMKTGPKNLALTNPFDEDFEQEKEEEKGDEDD